MRNRTFTSGCGQRGYGKLLGSIWSQGGRPLSATSAIRLRPSGKPSDGKTLPQASGPACNYGIGILFYGSRMNSAFGKIKLPSPRYRSSTCYTLPRLRLPSPLRQLRCSHSLGSSHPRKTHLLHLRPSRGEQSHGHSQLLECTPAHLASTYR